MHYYQHHIGDFIKDTSFLTNEEVGIYLKLIWLYYDTEKPLPDDIAVICTKVNARLKEEYVTSILKIFFKLKDGFWHHSRCDETISDYHHQLEIASKAGKASAAKRAANKNSTNNQHKSNERSTSVQPTNNHKPITNNHIDTPSGVTESVFKDYLEVRKTKKAKWTETALKGLTKEAEKAGISLQDAMELCCARGWVGFKADWIKTEQTKAKELPLGTDQQIADAYRIECGGDPTKARFNSYFEMRKYVLDFRDKQKRGMQ